MNTIREIVFPSPSPAAGPPLRTFLGTSRPRRYHRANLILGILLSLVPAARAVDFGKRSVIGGYWHDDVRITNATSGPLSLAPGTNVTGAAAADYQISELAAGPVAPGEDLIVRVTFNPSAAGSRAAQLSVVTSNAVVGTVVFPLAGEGGDYPETVLDAPVTHSFGGTVSGSLRLQQGTLSLTGDLTLNGDLVLAGGSVILNGFTLNVMRDMLFPGAVTVPAAAGSKVTVGGHVLMRAGMLALEGGEVETSGDCRLQYLTEAPEGQWNQSYSTALLRMQNPAGKLTVRGDFITDSTVSHAGYLTGGTLELKGNFLQLSSNAINDAAAPYNFSTSASHRVLLTGTAAQTLTFTNPGGYSHFQILELGTAVPIHHLPSLNTNAMITNGHALTGGLTVSALNFTLQEDVTVAGDMTLAGSVLYLNGHTLSIQGRLLHSAGQMVVNAGRLAVTGDYRIQSQSGGNYTFSLGILNMQNPGDHVVVGGDFITDSTVSHVGYLTGGTLELNGNFLQLSSNAINDAAAPYNFSASASHRVLVTGAAARTLTFTNPGGYSHFQLLELGTAVPIHHLPSLNTNAMITNGHALTGGLTVSELNFTLQEDVTVAGDMTLAGAVLNLNGHTLSIQGRLLHSAGQMVVNAGRLAVTGDYRLQAQSGGNYTFSLGILTMQNSADRVVVGGDFITDSTISHVGYLTDGTLELKGNFLQLSSNAINDAAAPYNFSTSASHRVLLSGAASQTLTFTNPGGYSHFQMLEVGTAAPVQHLPSLNTVALTTNGHPLTGGLTVSALGFPLQEDVTVSGDMTLAGAVLDLNGHTLSIQGRLLHSAGQMVVNAGRLAVSGDYRLQTQSGGNYTFSVGLLIMQNAADQVVVGGNFITDSTVSHVGYLTGGTLELEGNFLQLSSNAINDANAVYNFSASVSHRVLLSGAAAQTLTFTNPGGYSHFQMLELATAVPVHHLPSLNTNAMITNGHPLTSGLTVAALSFTLQEDITVAGDMTLAGAVLNLNGRTLSIQGRLLHSAGQMVVNAGRLAVTGDYRLQSQSSGNYTFSLGILTMQNPADRVVVGGDFITDSTGSHVGYLTAGTLELKGDFAQMSSNALNDSNAPYSFASSASHRVLLTGGSEQHISFINPDHSHFTTLELLNNPAAVVTFDTRAVVTALFDHHQRTFVLAPGALPGDFPDSDGDGIRDPQEAFPVGDADNNSVPDNATAVNYSYNAWAALFFWQGDPNLAQTSAPDADPDHDGVPNALEYVMATLPMRAEKPRYQLSVTSIGGIPHLTLTYPHVKVSDGSISSSSVMSTTLQAGGWTPGPAPVVLSDDGQVEMLRVIDSAPVIPGGKRFMAIRGQRIVSP